MKKVSQEIQIGGKTLTLQTGQFAEQANAAVTARIGDTIVLATVVAAPLMQDLGYFPLGVEYFERLYAGGRIKGSRFVKREGRPSDEATLTARLIDRSIRPLFPEGYNEEVQVIITVLSVDGENQPDVAAACATSAALAISDIPWDGPIGALRMGFVAKDHQQGVFVANPTFQDLEYSDLDLIVSATKKAVVMLEGGAREVPEATILEGIKQAQQEAQKIIKAIEALQKQVGQKKKAFDAPALDPKLVAAIEKETADNLSGAVKEAATKGGSSSSLAAIKKALLAKYEDQKKETINKIVDKLVKKTLRQQVLVKGERIDGRKLDEIRPIEIEVSVLPRTHGSAMFRRGGTQALTITTLGSPALEQLIENMEGEETKRYIHHYNMPPFTVGETGRLGWPSRREIGHGALAERALLPVIPAEEQFPYTIRVVSEIMSSNGSTSMASVCGSTLSLMDAGVPIKAPVSGIAMGMISDDGQAVILSDILGFEDFNGDMDFKVAGTKQGVTAIQMDVKKSVLDLKLLSQALEQAKKGRLFILEKMLQALPVARQKVSEFAPKVAMVKIPEEKIGEVIGPGGKMIRKIIAETGASVDIDDDGVVSITALSRESVDQAIKWVEGLTREPKVGEVFEEAEVKRLMPFGAFVEILPGKEGLVHVSRMAPGFVQDPADIVKIGQKVKVVVVEIDELHRVNLSMVFGPQAERSFSPDRRPEQRFPPRDQRPRRRRD